MAAPLPFTTHRYFSPRIAAPCDAVKARMPNQTGSAEMCPTKKPHRPAGGPGNPAPKVSHQIHQYGFERVRMVPAKKGARASPAGRRPFLRPGPELADPEDDEVALPRSAIPVLKGRERSPVDDPDDDQGLEHSMAGHESQGGEEGLLMGHAQDGGLEGPRRDGSREADEKRCEEDLNHGSPSPTGTEGTG